MEIVKVSPESASVAETNWDRAPASASATVVENGNDGLTNVGLAPLLEDK